MGWSALCDENAHLRFLWREPLDIDANKYKSCVSHGFRADFNVVYERF